MIPSNSFIILLCWNGKELTFVSVDSIVFSILFCISMCKYLQRMKSKRDYERTNKVCVIRIKTKKYEIDM
jgi:hypothetical protein